MDPGESLMSRASPFCARAGVAQCRVRTTPEASCPYTRMMVRLIKLIKLAVSCAETKMRESSRGLEVGSPVISPSPKLEHVRRAPPLPRTTWKWPLRNEAEFERGVGELEGFGFDTLSFGSDDLCHLIQELFRKLDLPSQLRIPEQKIQVRCHHPAP